MSEENVEAFRRALAAYNRRDIEALLEELDPDVEWHSLILVMFGGQESMYRGHDGIREGVRDMDEALADLHVEHSEIRDLGERIVVIGRARARGRASGVEIESPLSWIVEFRGGRATRIRDYLDPKEALEVAGLRQQGRPRAG